MSRYKIKPRDSVHGTLAVHYDDLLDAVKAARLMVAQGSATEVKVVERGSDEVLFVMDRSGTRMSLALRLFLGMQPEVASPPRRVFCQNMVGLSKEPASRYVCDTCLRPISVRFRGMCNACYRAFIERRYR